MGKLLIVLPSLWMLIDRVVYVAPFLGIHIPPVVLRMPVWLREIGADGKMLGSEGIEHMFKYIATRVVLKGMVGDGEIRLF